MTLTARFEGVYWRVRSITAKQTYDYIVLQHNTGLWLEEAGNVAKWFAASLPWRPWSQGWWINSHPSLVVTSSDKVLSAWWNLTSSKLKKSEAKLNWKTRKRKQLLSESGFVPCVAPPSLSRDRRIKTRKLNELINPWQGFEPTIPF